MVKVPPIANLQTVSGNYKSIQLETLEIVRDRLEKLKALDKSFQVFGAIDHRYEFNPTLSSEQIIEFEKEHKVHLPEEYRNFLLTIGNGGAGPNYGLLQLEISIHDTPFDKTDSAIINLSNEFRFKTLWNLDDFPSEDYSAWEKEYEDSKWTDGIIRISHQGCGTFDNLIISGEERGNIWTDDRANDGGIYPVHFHENELKTGFLTWYLNWIDISIQSIKQNYH